MSNMELNESLERFEESLKRAASRARELAKIQRNHMWLQIAKSYEGFLDKGGKLARSRSRGKDQINTDIDNYKATLATQQEPTIQ